MGKVAAVICFFSTFSYIKSFTLPQLEEHLALPERQGLQSTGFTGAKNSSCATSESADSDVDDDFTDLNQTDTRLWFGQSVFRLELLVLLDSDMVAAVEATNLDLGDYIQVFFHGVNHIYEMSHKSVPNFPRLEIVVANYKVLDPTFASDIFQPVANEDGNSIIDIEEVLRHLRKKAKSGEYDAYDHTMLLTGKDLYRMENHKYHSDVLGVAFINGTCSKSSDEDYEAFSIVEDVDAHFFGVYPASHEIAHNLGAKHDSSKSTLPACHASKGFIMTPTSTLKTTNMYQFSKCSLKSMLKFFRSESSSCLTTNTHGPFFPVDSNPKFPGEFYNLTDICTYLAHKIYANELDSEAEPNPARDPSSLCKQISCKVRLHSGHKVYIEPPYSPAEHTKCGDSRVCKSGECVKM